MDIKEYHWSNGIIQEKQYLENGKYHREDGPAITEYNRKGCIQKEIYCKNNKIHRIGGPAWIDYYPSGKISYEGYYIEGKRHREDSPARIWYYENGNIEKEEYWTNDFQGNVYQYDMNLYKNQSKQNNPTPKKPYEEKNISKRKIIILNEE